MTYRDSSEARYTTALLTSSGSTHCVGSAFMNTFPVEMVDARDISNAVLWLASDESRYVTGLELTVDAGNTIR